MSTKESPRMDGVRCREIVEDAEIINGSTTPAELHWLCERASELEAGDIWVEVGRYEGRSLISVGLSLTAGCRLVSIDDGTRPVGDCSQIFSEISRRRVDLQVMNCSSVHAAAHFPRCSIAACFLDGAHDRDSVAADIEAWAPKLRPGGLMCGHDYQPQWPGVMQAVDEIYRGRQRVSTGTLIWHVRDGE